MDIIDINTCCKRTVPKQTLTLDLLKEAPNGWETAVIYPLPENPSLELIQEARLNVLDYLDFYSQGMNATEEHLVKTLQIGFDKLREIATLIIRLVHPFAAEDLPDDDIPF